MEGLPELVFYGVCIVAGMWGMVEPRVGFSLLFGYAAIMLGLDALGLR